MALLPREQTSGTRLTARNWNDSVGAISRHQSAIERISPTPTVKNGFAPVGVVVKIHNNTGSYLAPRHIGGIDTHTFPADPSSITLTVVTPVEGVHDGKFVVCLEEIPEGTIGRAILSGTALCTVTINSLDHEFAVVLDGDATKLESAAAGEARILWHEDLSGSVPEDVLALVEYPTGGASSSKLYKATTDEVEATGKVDVKLVDMAGTTSGNAIEVNAFDGSNSIQADAIVSLLLDDEGKTVAAPVIGSNVSPAVMDGSTTQEAAHTDTWDGTDQAATEDGVSIKVCTRVIYDDTSDKVLYYYYRTMTYDSFGALKEITAETRVTVDTPVACT